MHRYFHTVCLGNATLRQLLLSRLESSHPLLFDSLAQLFWQMLASVFIENGKAGASIFPSVEMGFLNGTGW
jgi:hypothetical protein